MTSTKGKITCCDLDGRVIDMRNEQFLQAGLISPATKV